MISSKDPQQDPSLVGKSTEVFLDYYNDNIPYGFPHATRKLLVDFQAQYPSLFKDSKKWTINQHRKKLMDWLASHRSD